MRKTAKTCRIAVVLVLPVLFGLGRSLSATSPSACDTGKMLASKLQNDVEIGVMNEHGKLTAGDNSLCIVFRKVETGDPADIQNVSMEFRLLVGKIQEKPIEVQLTQIGVGYYRGVVNLGRQYYDPASYYAFVHYMDLAGTKKTKRFLLTVKNTVKSGRTFFPNLTVTALSELDPDSKLKRFATDACHAGS